MWISMVWHGKCNGYREKKSAYEKDHCIKPGRYIAVLCFVAHVSTFLNGYSGKRIISIYFHGNTGVRYGSTH